MIDLKREAAYELAKEYCDDHMSYFAYRDCVTANANRFWRSAKDEVELIRIREECHEEAIHDMSHYLGNYFKTFKECVDSRLDGGE